MSNANIDLVFMAAVACTLACGGRNEPAEGGNHLTMAGTAASAAGSSGGRSQAGASGRAQAGSAPNPIQSGGAGGAGAGATAGGGAGAAGEAGQAGGPAPGGSGAPGVSKGWTHMGYDHRNWYFNPNETAIDVGNAATLVEKWRFTVSGFPPGSPLIVEGKVYVMATAGTYAIDLQTGMKVWERLDLGGTASLAYADGFIYAHTSVGPNSYKLNASDGTTAWGPIVTYEFEGCDGMSSPVPVGDRVMVGHSCGVVEVSPGAGGGQARGGVAAFATADGKRLWTYYTADANEDGAMVWSTVGVDIPNNVVYATTGNNYTVAGPNSDAIHAIDLATGMRKWVWQARANDIWSLLVNTSGPDGDLPVNPIVMDDMVAAGDKVACFWAVDKAGQKRWGREQLTPSRSVNYGGIINAGAFDGQRLYTISNDPNATTSILSAFDPAAGENAWEPKRYGKLVFGGVSAANGVLYAAIDDDLVVLDAATGEELKLFNTGGTIAGGAPAVAEGRVVVGSGLNYAFAPTAKFNNQVIAYGLP